MEYITIDIFKGHTLYKSLQQYNKSIERVSLSSNYEKGGFYNTKENEASLWFDYRRVRETLLNACYPNIHPVQKDARLCLHTHAPNHIALLLINLLYEDKEILIEDICCGMGNLIFFLSKLGYKNFNAIDNFSQLPQELFERLMKKGNIKYFLNHMKYEAVVSNLIGYPHYIKIDENNNPFVSSFLELFLCSFDLENKELSLINNEYCKRLDFVPLCKDKYSMLYAYCRKNKYEEFSEKLQTIKLGE